MNDIISHIRHADGDHQTVVIHRTETATINCLLVAKLNLDFTDEFLGLMHDCGKYSAAFQ